jgi:hypothetical protein
MEMRIPVTHDFTIGSVAAILIIFTERWSENIHEATDCQRTNYSILRAKKQLKLDAIPTLPPTTTVACLGV